MTERVVWSSDGDPLIELVERSSGHVHLREQSGSPGVVVLAVAADGRILLGRHERPAVSARPWELPRGFGESGEPLEDALRELREETGYTGAARLIGHLYPNSGLLASSIAVVLVEAEADPVAARDEEMSELRWWTRAELDALLAGPEPVDGITAAALCLFDARGSGSGSGEAG